MIYFWSYVQMQIQQKNRNKKILALIFKQQICDLRYCDPNNINWFVVFPEVNVK